MDRSWLVLKNRYLKAQEKIALRKIENLMHRGSRQEAETEVERAEREALHCDFDQANAIELANEAATLEDEAIKAGVPSNDLWNMDPFEFAEKWCDSLVIRKHLRRTTSLTVTQDIAAHLSAWRSAVPAYPDRADG